MQKSDKKFAIIGMGNMGSAILKGLNQKEYFPKENITLVDVDTTKLELWNKEGFKTLHDEFESIRECDIVFIAIKPQDINEFLNKIKAIDGIQNKLFISIAAGITTSKMLNILGQNISIARVMPNLCASVSMSMSCWFSVNLDVNQKQIVKTILESVGSELELESENQLDAVTAISGSGPAYYFYLTELLEQSAIKLGLSAEIAKKIISATYLGSAKVFENKSTSAEELRKAVTSKGGTTEAAIQSFDSKNIKEIIEEGTLMAKNRSEELSNLN